MSRNHRNRARARRAAARLNSPPSKGGARGGTHVSGVANTRPLRLEQLEPRRVLAPIVVTTPLDVVDFNDGLTSLREAIFAANTVPGLDEIAFDFGHDGPETILLKHGELTITDEFTLTGPGAELLTIDASGNDATPDLNNGDGSRVFNILFNNPRASAHLSAVTLTGGDVTGDGGAIRSTPALTLTDVRLFDNAATLTGGGVVAGGLTLRDSIVARNLAGIAGGGISAGAAVIHNSAIDSNHAAKGGGMAVNGKLSIYTSTISNNSATDGGGIWTSAKFIEMRDSTISGNSALNDAGGIYSKITGISVMRSTIAENKSDADGDGAGRGGGIFTTMPVSLFLSHSILAENSTGAGDADDLIHSSNNTLRSFHSFHSVVGYLSQQGRPEAPLGAPDSGGNLIGGPIHGAIDPLLAPLANNGGPTLTHALLPGSPAINAGDPNFTPGQGGAPEFDQRGAPFTLVAGGRIDIGAFELQSPGGALQADFDLDGDADGNDLLTWQRNLGKTTGATLRHGDATADGDVDSNDLAVWRARFSAGEESFGGQSLGSPPVEAQIVRPAATPIRRSTFQLPIAAPAESPRRDALAQYVREPLTPRRRTAFNGTAPAALDAAHLLQGLVTSPSQEASNSAYGGLVAALDAAFSER